MFVELGSEGLVGEGDVYEVFWVDDDDGLRVESSSHVQYQLNKKSEVRLCFVSLT